MTLTTITRSLSVLSLCTLFATATASAQTGGDYGAAWEPMFSSTGTIPASGFVGLGGGPLPVLGTQTQIRLVAPGFGFGFISVSRSAHSGQGVPIGLDPLEIYVDPLLSLGTYALPLLGGQAQLNLPLPPDPALSGLELAFQAVVLDQQNNLAASNLLCGNFGIFGGAGRHFGFRFGAVNISRFSYWNVNGQRQAIVNNATAAAKDYTISGSKNQGGTLEIRDQTGAVLATFGPNDTAINITLTVPPGTQLFWYNNSSGTINGVTWQVDVG